METIYQTIYNSDRLFKINDQIINWDLEKRHGMQKWTGHDRYGFIEINLHELNNY